MTRLKTILPTVMTAVALAGASPLPVSAQTVGSITIAQPWARATPNNAPVAGGYLTITNRGGPDKLLDGSTEIASKIEVHEMSMENGVMKMREIPGGLTIPAEGEVQLKPAGYHLMFQGLKHGLKEGDHFQATLRFEKAGPIVVNFAVGSIAGMKAPTMDMPMHAH